MTTRERAEARLERRRLWAASRREKAAERYSQGDPYRGDIAFNTQPGYISERARVIRATEKAVEHMNMADHHEAKAAGIERQLARTIFSDDENAVEALQAKIAKERADVERMKTANKIVRKFKTASPEAIAAFVAAGLPESWAKLFTPDFFGRIGFPSYALTNANANIRRMEKRIEEIKRRNERIAQAEAAPGGVVIQGADYVSITFAKKPDREILNALKAAGFHWSGGCWNGYRKRIPAEVTEAANPTTEDDGDDSKV